MSAAEEPTDLQEIIKPMGKSIIQFLHDTRNGATVQDILHYLRAEFRDQDSERLNQNVQSVLEKGSAYGFLDRKGSHFANWTVKEERCGRRRRRRRKSCCCKRRRRRRRRSRRRRRRC